MVGTGASTNTGPGPKIRIYDVLHTYEYESDVFIYKLILQFTVYDINKKILYMQLNGI